MTDEVVFDGFCVHGTQGSLIVQLPLGCCQNIQEIDFKRKKL